MRRAAAFLAFACVVLGSAYETARAAAPIGAASRGRVEARATPVAPPLDAASVLARYRSALATLRRPAVVSFEYSLAQLGLHDMEQTHRVYRSGRSERDETLVIDGYRLKAPAVRIITGPVAHYDVASVAPRPDAYRFVPVAAIRVGNGYRYHFRTVALRRRAVVARELDLDGHTFLPAIVRFATASGGVRGSGELRYFQADAYWVIRSARVDATLRDGKRARERIVFQQYHFPNALPAGTFRASPTAKPPAGAVPPGAAKPPAGPSAPGVTNPVGPGAAKPPVDPAPPGVAR
ncbi:MAG: hypothetical protein PVSMB8_07220 [Vulcanimicrobiaceae bacterium]